MPRIDSAAVEAIVRDVAATEIMPRFRKLGADDVAFKIGDDPVTVADKAAEKDLTRRLMALLPGSCVVGEEACSDDAGVLRSFSGDDPVWIIDPIDGTRNFVAGDPGFGVIVALAHRQETLAGWLYDPNSDEFVTAEKGSGAFHQGRRLAALPPQDLPKMVGSLGITVRQHYDALDPARRSAEGPEVVDTIWSSCHEAACMAVAGPHFTGNRRQFHFRTIYNSGTPWDDAAGVLIFCEAGGHVAHWNGEPVLPSSTQRGFMFAPDVDSWRALRNWVAGFCPLPE